MSLNLPELFLVGAIFVLAGLVKGIVGMGLPAVAMGMLGAAMTPSQAAALLVVPSFITNIWQLFTGPDVRMTVLRLWPMMVALAVGTLASAGIIAAGDTRLAVAGLGGVLVLYALIGLLKVRLDLSEQAERRLRVPVGLATGFVAGATGVFTVPAVPFIAALGLTRDDLVQALGLTFTVATVALAAGLALHGALPVATMGASLFALVPALGGMWIGSLLRRRISPETFRKWFFAGLLLLGGEILWRALA